MGRDVFGEELRKRVRQVLLHLSSGRGGAGKGQGARGHWTSPIASLPERGVGATPSPSWACSPAGTQTGRVRCRPAGPWLGSLEGALRPPLSSSMLLRGLEGLLATFSQQLRLGPGPGCGLAGTSLSTGGHRR